MPSQAEIDEFRSHLNVVSALAAAEVAKIAASVASDPPAQMETILLAAIPQVLRPFLSAASALAMSFYKDPASLSAPQPVPSTPRLPSPGPPAPRPPSPRPEVVAAPAARIVGPTTRPARAAANAFEPHPVDIPDEQIDSSVRWAVEAARAPVESTMPQRLEAAVQRHVHNAARDTITANAKAERVRWYRHPRADACAFCRMLATRGPKYLTAESARFVVGRRGKQRGTRAIGELYHDHCFCLPVAVRAGDSYDPPEYIDAWMEEYQAAAMSTNGSTKAIIAAMRKNDPPRDRTKTISLPVI
ncbi:hypothetical protein [Nocardia sp. NPDC057030]|uniref:VG15 protein n=1 Tax=unclassified Nocardia TaxID=2637762 RepID=UPI003627D2FA